MSHYYSDSPDVSSNESVITYEYNQTVIKLTTDNGVFSKSGVDYGSKVLVKAIVEDQSNMKRLLDVGCGYGTIGLMLSKLSGTDMTLHMVDVNERALGLATKNAGLNQITANIYKSDALNGVSETFDVVVSNPPIRAGKEVVHRILEDSKVHLNIGGALYIVIQKKQGMPSAKKKMEEVYGNVEVLLKDKGYYVLKSING